MKKHISIMIVLTLMLSLYSCGNSNVNGTTGAGNDVAFDPSKSTRLEVVHYTVILNRLLVDFGLTNGSAAVTLLNQQQNVFKIANPTYTSLFGVQYTNIFNLACRDMDTVVLFPDGADMDHAWETLTGKKMDAASNKLEADVLAATSGRPEDEQIFALCFAVTQDINVMAINYVSGE
jgi:hypothetical protein